jgi:hypothetical protein
VPISDFISITEKYRSSDGNYIVGRIGFDKLIRSSWAHNQGVSILLTPTFNAEPYHNLEQFDLISQEHEQARLLNVISKGL